MSHILTEAERNRFATYCEAEAYSYDQLAVQSEKLGAAFAPIVQLQRTQAAAYALVARHLRNTEALENE